MEMGSSLGTARGLGGNRGNKRNNNIGRRIQDVNVSQLVTHPKATQIFSVSLRKSRYRGIFIVTHQASTPRL
jgi:hypothetical protein